jgi:NAD(P)-dependent dehydrogenase (short-subunit alcohol dehydrogenase family)
VLASAATVIIVARSVESLNSTALELENLAKEFKSPTKIIARKLDVSKDEEINTVWNELIADGTTIDVLVNNAAKFTEPKSMFELGIDEIWSQTQVNFRSGLLLTQKLYEQESKSQKFLINNTTAAIHMLNHPLVQQRPAYSLTKAMGTYTAQLLAKTIKPEQMQIISFHPGLIYGAGWVEMGITKDALPFDDGKFCHSAQ